MYAHFLFPHFLGSRAQSSALILQNIRRHSVVATFSMVQKFIGGVVVPK
jgi:hypothetical protein